MKRLFVFTIVTVMFLAGFYSHAKSASFENLNEGKDNYIIEKIAGDVYIKADSRITIKDNVPGDVFAIGQQVIIEGDVDKNVYASARMVEIRGNVSGSVYLAGGDIVTNGDIKGDLYATGMNVRISGDIGGDLNAVGARVKVEGRVSDDARLIGLVVVVDNDVNGDLIVRAPISSVNGNVGNDLVNTGGTLNFESGNLLGSIMNFDNATTNLSNEVKQDKALIGDSRELGSDSQEDGQMVQDEAEYRDTLKTIGTSMLWVFVESIGFIILGIFILRFAPVKVNSSLWMMENFSETGKSFGIGFVALPAILIIGLILGVTIIGIPLLLFLFGTFLAISMMCIPLVGIRLGKAILGLSSIKDRYYLSLVIGIIILAVLMAIPYVGAFVNMIVFMLGIGAMIRMQFTKFTRARKYI